jgi:hypothetical protein
MFSGIIYDIGFLEYGESYVPIFLGLTLFNIISLSAIGALFCVFIGMILLTINGVFS